MDSTVKPDKNTILQESINEIQRIKQEGEYPASRGVTST